MLLHQCGCLSDSARQSLRRPQQPLQLGASAVASTIMHADPELQRLAQAAGVLADNFFVYLLGLTIQAGAFAAFERRKGLMCEACAKTVLRQYSHTHSQFHGIDFLVD